MKSILLIFCFLMMFTSCNSTDVEVVEPEIIEEIALEKIPDIQTEEALEELAPNPKNNGYFNSSLFVGDSIMEGIRQYVARVRKEETLLGDARFVTTTRWGNR